jgi:hypothetical protein
VQQPLRWPGRRNFVVVVLRSQSLSTVAVLGLRISRLSVATTTQPGPRGLRSKQYRFSKRTRRRYYDSIFDSPLQVGPTLQPKLIAGGSLNNCFGRMDGFKVDTTLVKMALVLSGFSLCGFPSGLVEVVESQSMGSHLVRVWVFS